MPTPLPNDELKIELLPSIDDAHKIFSFAMLFNGYKHHGSFEGSAQRASERKRNSLTEIRNELFFSARSSRHCDDETYLKTYEALLPLIIRKIKQEDFV